MDYRLKGSEKFSYQGNGTGMSILDFWRWHFCERFDLQDKIAEFIVAKALGLTQADNVGQWTLYDILYKGTRIEVKESSYVHAWQTDNEPKSKSRIFGIGKAYSEYMDNTSKLERQNDIHVFCLNTGFTREESGPLKLENWEFYIVPTETINKECGDAKTISLSRLSGMTEAVDYTSIKDVIDGLIINIQSKYYM